MKKFKFRMQKLLDIREKKEELAKREFSKALRKMESEKGVLGDLFADLDDKNANQKAVRASGKIDWGLESFHLNYYIGMKNNMTNQQIKINQASNVLERKRRELIETSKDRKVIDTLKDKKLQEYRLEADREEQKFMDELATLRANRENILNPY